MYARFSIDTDKRLERLDDDPRLTRAHATSVFEKCARLREEDPDYKGMVCHHPLQSIQRAAALKFLEDTKDLPEFHDIFWLKDENFIEDEACQIYDEHVGAPIKQLIEELSAVFTVANGSRPTVVSLRTNSEAQPEPHAHFSFLSYAIMGRGSVTYAFTKGVNGERVLRPAYQALTEEIMYAEEGLPHGSPKLRSTGPRLNILIS